MVKSFYSSGNTGPKKWSTFTVSWSVNIFTSARPSNKSKQLKMKMIAVAELIQKQLKEVMHISKCSQTSLVLSRCHGHLLCLENLWLAGIYEVGNIIFLLITRAGENMEQLDRSVTIYLCLCFLVIRISPSSHPSTMTCFPRVWRMILPIMMHKCVNPLIIAKSF